MNYEKIPLSIDDQINKLEERGLKIDKNIAKNYLSNISYYRLRAYTYPFQDNSDENHPFIKEISFNDIVDLYVFDRRLRLLLLNAIEKIEIAFRTKIIHSYSIATNNSHWHLDENIFRNKASYNSHIIDLNKEVGRSKEVFIEHYREKYRYPEMPPCWMSLEVSSLGLLSKIFQNLNKIDIGDSTVKDNVCKEFGLVKIDILENWMFCLSNLRNICAHHGRVWNRRLPSVKIPSNPLFVYVENTKFHNNKLYALLTCMQYLLNLISPKSSFRQDLLNLIESNKIVNLKDMGFPDGWLEDKFWIE